MKKQYTHPQTISLQLSANTVLNAGTTGVSDGQSVGKGYSSSDVSYSRQSHSWGDDEE